MDIAVSALAKLNDSIEDLNWTLSGR
jgi:hypothetical protein